jgi:hypothetical protein
MYFDIYSGKNRLAITRFYMMKKYAVLLEVVVKAHDTEHACRLADRLYPSPDVLVVNAAEVSSNYVAGDGE